MLMLVKYLLAILTHIPMYSRSEYFLDSPVRMRMSVRPVAAMAFISVSTSSSVSLALAILLSWLKPQY